MAPNAAGHVNWLKFPGKPLGSIDQKPKHGSTSNSAIVLLQCVPRSGYAWVHHYIHRRLFITKVFIIEDSWKQPAWSVVEDWSSSVTEQPDNVTF